MLPIKSLKYSLKGDIDMAIRHEDYTIRIISRKYKDDDTMAIVLGKYGSFFSELIYIGNNNHKDVKARIHKISTGYYLRYPKTKVSVLKTILNDKAYEYHIDVIVTKFGVGLCNLSTRGVYSVQPKETLKKSINEVVKKAYKYARQYESNIFGGSHVGNRFTDY